jgi:hypothetical protein
MVRSDDRIMAFYEQFRVHVRTNHPLPTVN